MLRFGTDGVRGVANVDLTATAAVALAMAAVAVFRCDEPALDGLEGQGLEGSNARASAGRPRLRAAIGRDPRPSGAMLESAIAAGLTSAGVDVIMLGVIPTPGVAHIVNAWGLDFGVMISASHNPMPDNGIKFFGPHGKKIADTMEAAIEHQWHTFLNTTPVIHPPITGSALGRITHDTQGAAQYTAHLLQAWNQLHNTHNLLPTWNSTNPITVVLDCANGAASALGPQLLHAIGFNVIPINTDLSGDHINDNCGSTHLESLSKHVNHQQAHIGIALDGDADRCMAVASDGSIIDGDTILTMLAIMLKNTNLLRHNTIAATVMSNYGLHTTMAQHGITVATTPVGDKNILEEMTAHDYALGGEQSGHIIISDYATTGDGLLTTLYVLFQLSHSSSVNMAALLKRMPQYLINVPVKDKNTILSNTQVHHALTTANATVAGSGRVLLRPSGTEELFRIMVESEDATLAQELAQHLANIISQQ